MGPADELHRPHDQHARVAAIAGGLPVFGGDAPYQLAHGTTDIGALLGLHRAGNMTDAWIVTTVGKLLRKVALEALRQAPGEPSLSPSALHHLVHALRDGEGASGTVGQAMALGLIS